MSAEWPEWARALIAAYGQSGITSAIGVPLPIFDYIVARMKREYLDAMLDAEIGINAGQKPTDYTQATERSRAPNRDLPS